MKLSWDLPLKDISLYVSGQIKRDFEVIGISKPGEGNMNFVMKAESKEGSVVLKQANPFVQKYPQIAAPEDRIATENHFFTATTSLSNFLPQVLSFDAQHHILITEYIDNVGDYTQMYAKPDFFTEKDLQTCLQFLRALHEIKTEEYPLNLELRTLNHQHLVVFPMMLDNGFDLDSVQPGLQTLSLKYKENTTLKSAMNAIGHEYMNTGGVLLHGDFYPGSWLKSSQGLMVIDPEFSFEGSKEYDMGIFKAHLMLSRIDTGALDAQIDPNYDLKWVDKFCGMEIIRRLIGLAQLPLKLTVEEKESLLETAQKLVLS